MGETAPKKQFHHVGITTLEELPGEDYVTASDCYVTNPNDHPYRIEYLRYPPGCPISEEFRTTPHIAYAVDELEPHLEGKDVMLAPFDVDDPPFARVAFTKEDGLIVEYMQFYPGRTWFGGK